MIERNTYKEQVQPLEVYYIFLCGKGCCVKQGSSSSSGGPLGSSFLHCGSLWAPVVPLEETTRTARSRQFVVDQLAATFSRNRFKVPLKGNTWPSSTLIAARSKRSTLHQRELQHCLFAVSLDS